jgi:hypothetical protein
LVVAGNEAKQIEHGESSEVEIISRCMAQKTEIVKLIGWGCGVVTHS